MPTSLNSILDVNPQMRKAEVKPPSFEQALDTLKSGARHGKKDKQLVQTAHDTMAALVDAAHCDGGMTDAQKAAGLQKANARHSKADLDRIKKAHDLTKELGAECPSPHKETGGN